MATDVQEISEPQAPEQESEDSGKSEKMVFAGDYVADDKGFVTLTVRFPLQAVRETDSWRPVEGLLALAGRANLKGYGEDDAPQATLGVERAKITDKTSGQKIDNPHAGRPTGAINLVLHTEDSLAEARKRGRTGMTDAQKKASDAASKLVKGALATPGNEERVQEIADKASRGEITAAEALVQIAALMQ